jgi:hypothetical protein
MLISVASPLSSLALGYTLNPETRGSHQQKLGRRSVVPFVKLSNVVEQRCVAERTYEMEELASQLNLSLSLIQGIVLNHGPSKEHLGRKCSLEVNPILYPADRK